jgi:hypothetical protein
MILFYENWKRRGNYLKNHLDLRQNPQQMLKRAQGSLLGQLAGDTLGGLVEFQSREEIRRSYPNGARELADGGT